MSTLRITQACDEFGQAFTVGQIVSNLSPLQELAMVLSGLAQYLPASASAAATMPSEGVVPITSVQFAAPQAFGLAVVSARTVEFDRVHYVWGGSSWTVAGSRRRLRSGLWYPVRDVTMRLLLSGSGNATLVGRSAAGVEGPASGPFSVGGTDTVTYAYPGDEAVEFRVDLTGSATVQEI